MTSGRYIACTIIFALIPLSCGRENTLVLTDEPVYTYTETERYRYTWREGDGWAFLAWAMDIDGGAEVLALQTGFLPQERPEPGDTVTLPLHQDLSEALENRLESARLVRQATEVLRTGDTLAVRGILLQAMEHDPAWSVPAYDLSLIMLRQDGPQAVIELLQPIAHKYDAALLQSEIAWNRGDTDDALRQLEICLMDDNPPYEALAAAALIYTVTGHYYQASGIWREILASPEADAAIRLMAVEYAILQEERSQRE
jgi:tetratricopeptide (TPR) repeat protein